MDQDQQDQIASFVKSHIKQWLEEEHIALPAVPAALDGEALRRIENIEQQLKFQNEKLQMMMAHSDKRFEEIQSSMDKRFEAVDKRFEAVDKRFEDMQNNMDKRFEDMNKRFDDNLRYMDKRFGFLFSISAGILIATLAPWILSLLK